MKIRYKKRFTKSYQKLPNKARKKVKEKIDVFLVDPFAPQLRNHSLHGKYEGKRSFDISGDVRVIFEELSDGSYMLVELIDVGTHSQLYG